MLFCLTLGVTAAVVVIDEVTEPAGYFLESTPVDSGTVYTSKTAPVAFDAQRFAYWKLNGVRQADAQGRAVNPVKFTATENTTLVAVYTMGTLDSDLDGILDFFEFEFYGDLTKTASSDTDLDGFSFFSEYLLGFHPTVVDIARSIRALSILQRLRRWLLTPSASLIGS